MTLLRMLYYIVNFIISFDATHDKSGVVNECAFSSAGNETLIKSIPINETMKIKISE